MATTIVYRGYIGITDKEMETTIVSILGLYRAYIGIMEKENGNYHLGENQVSLL